MNITGNGHSCRFGTIRIDGLDHVSKFWAKLSRCQTIGPLGEIAPTE